MIPHTQTRTGKRQSFDGLVTALSLMCFLISAVGAKETVLLDELGGRNDRILFRLLE
jgi:hypothetical protein